MTDTPEENNFVQAEDVESVLEAKTIGKRIRRLRLSRSMGLVELGTRTGLSASFLSQLETGRVIPTLKHLARLSTVFEKDLHYFFSRSQEKLPPFRVLRAEDRIHLNLAGKGAAEMVVQNMSPLIPGRELVPCIADIAPSEPGVGFTPSLFRGLEFVYIMEGDLEMTVGREVQIASTGDAAWVDGAAARLYRSANDVRVKAMIVTFPEN